MRFTIRKDEFSKALTIADSIITNNTLSVLSNVLIQVSEKNITIISSDSSMYFSKEINPNNNEKGDILVNSTKLLNLIKKIESEEIELFTDEDNVLFVKPKNNKKSNYKLKGFSSDNYPLKNICIEKLISLDISTFFDMIKKTKISVSSESRRFLSGILFQIENKILKIVSTDGKRLSYIETSVDIPNVSAIIPIKILNEIIKISGETLQLSINGKEIIIKIDDYIFVSNLLDGNFPPYEKVIPDNQPNSIKVNRKDFLSSIGRIALMCDDSNKIRLKISNNNLSLYSENISIGSGEEVIDIEYDGNPIEIGFSYLYLQDVFNVLNTEHIVIEFKDSQSVISIREKEYLHVMMPMSIT